MTRGSPENQAKLGVAEAKRPKSKPTKSGRSKQMKLEFCQFPLAVLKIILATHNAELAVLAQLYQTWFTNFKKNPLTLTTLSLKKYRINRNKKHRALRRLEKSGIISVERRKTENPVVTLNWLEPSK